MTEEPRPPRSVLTRARKDGEPVGQKKYANRGRRSDNSRTSQPAAQDTGLVRLVDSLRATLADAQSRTLSPDERAALEDLIAAIADLLGPDLFTDG